MDTNVIKITKTILSLATTAQSFPYSFTIGRKLIGRENTDNRIDSEIDNSVAGVCMRRHHKVNPKMRMSKVMMKKEQMKLLLPPPPAADQVLSKSQNRISFLHF